MLKETERNVAQMKGKEVLILKKSLSVGLATFFLHFYLILYNASQLCANL